MFEDECCFLSFYLYRLENRASDEDKQKLQEVKTAIEHKKNQYRDLEEVLPHENGFVWQLVDMTEEPYE